MKQILYASAISVFLVSCTSHEQVPVELKDTASINTTNTAVDSSKVSDSGISTNGAAVRPIDTASSQRRNPKQ